MIAAKFPTLKDEPETVENFLIEVGLSTQLFEFAAEALYEIVRNEDTNADIADFVLTIRSNAVFKSLILNGSEYGLFQHRSKGGKTCIRNTEDSLVLMVHNTNAATGLGTHVPKFMSKRCRPGTTYVHSEMQGELDLDCDVIEEDFETKTARDHVTKIDVCVFAETVNGLPLCRIELLVDAELDRRNTRFISCKRRFAMTFKSEEFVVPATEYGENTEDFGELIKPKRGL